MAPTQRCIECIAVIGNLNGVDGEGFGEREPIGRHEIDASLGMTKRLLVEAEHAVAAIVIDEQRDRQTFLHEGGELAEEYRQHFEIDEHGNWTAGQDDAEREAAWAEYYQENPEAAAAARTSATVAAPSIAGEVFGIAQTRVNPP